MAVTYYDRNGRRVPAPRHDVVPSNRATVALVIVAIVLIIGIGVFALMGQRELVNASKATKTTKADVLVTHDSMTAVHTYNGEIIRFYVMTDPDTNIQYVVNDRGGMCVREQPYE